MSRWLPFLLPLLASCDDTVFVAPPKVYTSDWNGMRSLIDDQCAVCHGPGAGTFPVLPDDLLVDIQDGTGFYVVAGEPDNSVLWRVLANELVDGDFAVMPLGRGQLPSASVTPIRIWIEDGAVIPEATP